MPRCMRLFLILCGLLVVPFARAQTGTITGNVTDPTHAVIRSGEVSITSETQGTVRHVRTNTDGRYTASFVEPGTYKVSVQAPGFKTTESKPLTLTVNQTLVFDVQLQVGAETQTVVVETGAQTINTTDATVGTVVDRQFVEEIPLNGRSFQSLIYLTPGVVTASPQGNDRSGEFSVNGQRTDANNFSLDGLSANNGGGLSYGSTAGSAGMAPSSTSLGTTHAILSVDALQEFRISTSTYAAEFGRQPGAQVSFQSRAGTNAFHGTLFEYLRNTVFDANDWFNDYATPVIARPQERQNDFGGVFGGPVTIPKLYEGKDRAFFFFSYEGLRLAQPSAATVYYVPSNGTFNTATYSNPLWENVRANIYPTAPNASELKAVMNSFSVPNCSVAQDAQCIDYGDGLSPRIVSASNPSRVDALSARIDFQALPWLRIFARYSDTESSTDGTYCYGQNNCTTVTRNRLYVLGADSSFRGSLTNELRLQYSPVYYLGTETPAAIGGAVPVDLNALQGLPSVGGESTVQFSPKAGENAARLYQVSAGSRQFQPNAKDTISWVHGVHLFKGGVDYRQTTAYFGDGPLSRSPDGWYYYDNGDSIINNVTDSLTTINFARQDPTTKNLGLFFQDEWRVKPRLSLSLGLRWDFNPPPSISGAKQFTYAGDIHNPSTMSLAPLGTPLYKTTYTNFAPRFGMALKLINSPMHELVFRGGVGLFYDTGQATQSTLGYGDGLGAGNKQTLDGSPFPEPASTILLGEPAPIAPYSLSLVPAPNLFPPSTIQWNVSMEEALGQRQTITVSYVGASGQNLINEQEYSFKKVMPAPMFSTISQYENGPGSIYNSLQVQFRRQATRGLDMLAGYTWSHSIDSESTDYGFLPIQRGNSDHDVRNNFNAGLVYNLPARYVESWKRQTLGNWAIDVRAAVRSPFPVQVAGANATDVTTGEEYSTRLNYNGKNPYVHVKGIPGGRQFDPSVFSVPLASQDGIGTAPRNFLRGFDEAAVDTAIQRNFHLYEKLNLLFRAEAFNVTNHPNFGLLNTACGVSTAGAVCNSQLMGQATKTIGNAFGVAGGLASIYQQGGPRSLQMALKLRF
jgi:hypothetical protein